MSTNINAPTALERARIAYEQMKRREYNAAMKQRARAQHRAGGYFGGHGSACDRHRDLQRRDADVIALVGE